MLYIVFPGLMSKFELVFELSAIKVREYSMDNNDSFVVIITEKSKPTASSVMLWQLIAKKGR